MTDSFLTLLIIGACITFLGIKAIRSFQGKGGCGCSCSGGCSSNIDSCDQQGYPHQPEKINKLEDKR